MTKDIDIPCCKNCPCFEERDNVQLGEWTIVSTCCGKIIPEQTPMVTRNYGCLLHPRAREYLNRDMIAELDGRNNNPQNRYDAMFPNSRALYISFDNVIKLLKEGVKK